MVRAQFRTAPARTAFLLSIGILTVAFARVGPHVGVDTGRYIAVGHQVWNSLLGTSSTAAETWAGLFTTMYLFENVVMAAGDRLLGAAFPPLFVVMNIVLYSATVYLCFRIWELISPITNARAVIAALVVLFGCVDVPMWTFYLLGDTTFLFLVAAFWFHLTHGVLFRSRRSWILALAIAIGAAFVRPTAIVVIAFWFTAAAFIYMRARGFHRATIALAFIALPFIVAEFVWPYVIYRVAANGGQAPVMRLAFAELLPWYLKGAVVCDRPETYLAPPVAYLDFVRITLVRLVYFFFPLRAGYAPMHNLVLILYTPMLVAFAWLGWRELLRRGAAHASLAFLLLAFMYDFGLFHSMTYVDFDWRYQVPAMLSAFVIGGFGVARLFEAPGEVDEHAYA